jgi:hypothetical protein
VAVGLLQAGMGITARVDVITTTSVSVLDVESGVELVSAAILHEMVGTVAVVATTALAAKVVMLLWSASGRKTSVEIGYLEE